MADRNSVTLMLLLYAWRFRLLDFCWCITMLLVHNLKLRQQQGQLSYIPWLTARVQFVFDLCIFFVCAQKETRNKVNKHNTILGIWHKHGCSYANIYPYLTSPHIYLHLHSLIQARPTCMLSLSISHTHTHTHTHTSAHTHTCTHTHLHSHHACSVSPEPLRLASTSPLWHWCDPCSDLIFQAAAVAGFAIVALFLLTWVGLKMHVFLCVLFPIKHWSSFWTTLSFSRHLVQLFITRFV